jgi:hypothetical protein
MSGAIYPLPLSAFMVWTEKTFMLLTCWNLCQPENTRERPHARAHYVVILFIITLDYTVLVLVRARQRFINITLYQNFPLIPFHCTKQPYTFDVLLTLYIMYHNNVTNLIRFHFHNQFIVS